MDTSASLQGWIQPSPTASSTELDGETVILDLEHNRYVGLNHVGTRVWDLIQEGTTFANMKVHLAREYEKSSDQIEQDLLNLLARLREEGLIQVRTENEKKEESPAPSSSSLEDRRCVSPIAKERPIDPAQIEAIVAIPPWKATASQSGSRWIRPWSDWWMLLRAMVLTVLIRGTLSVCRLRTVTQGLRSLAHWLPQWKDPTARYCERAAWAANAVGHRFLPSRPCLTQALVLQYLLLRRGDDSTELRIGVTKGEDGELLAHAWVERGHRVLIGGTASPSRYKPLDGVAEKIGA